MIFALGSFGLFGFIFNLVAFHKVSKLELKLQIFDIIDEKFLATHEYKNLSNI